MKKWMKWLLAVLAVLLVCALLLPFPRKVKRTFSGLAYAPGREAVACTIDVDATRLCYLIRGDALKGSLALSTDPRTQGATLNAAEMPAFKGHSGGCFQLTGYQADGTPFTAGLFIAPADMAGSTCRTARRTARSASSWPPPRPTRRRRPSATAPATTTA